ncbi:MAG: AmmeMemoRadiSam system radical SAM enzyme [Nitrososphaeria archaeon]|nr:AmmeMemoRadiSam system radical SAM enzyme [Nitrososphaeria archaeon]
MQEATLYKKIEGNRIQCLACPRYCKLSEGQVGFCGVRKNIRGKLVLLVYGKPIAVHMDPIEKKPFSHFMPGSQVLSIGTVGCDWACQYCQNYDISQRRAVDGVDLMPERLVKLALEYDADGIAYTYNEPTIFIEYARDSGVLARKKGLFNVFVSNGYASPESVKLMLDFLDAITVDFKGNGEKRFLQKYAMVVDPEPIFQTLLVLKENNIHIEITDLIIPKVGDDIEAAKRLCRWILDNLGEDTPIHFLRFHPDYKMLNLPSTPLATLEAHYKVAKDLGLKYVYLGNVPGHPYESTYCPSCGRRVVGRYGFDITEWNLVEDNKCKFCGYKISIVGGLNKKALHYTRFYSLEI